MGKVVIKKRKGACVEGGFYFDVGASRYTDLPKSVIKAIEKRIDRMPNPGFKVEQDRLLHSSKVKEIPVIDTDYEDMSSGNLRELAVYLGIEAKNRDKYPRKEIVIKKIKEMIDDGEVKLDGTTE